MNSTTDEHGCTPVETSVLVALIRRDPLRVIRLIEETRPGPVYDTVWAAIQFIADADGHDNKARSES